MAKRRVGYGRMGEPVEMVGMIAPGGRMHSKFPGERPKFGAKFEAWRVEGGEIERRVYYVSAPMAARRVEAISPDFEDYAVIAVTVTPAHLDVDDDILRGYIDAYHGPTDDPELLALAAELEKPVSIRDEVLGELEFSRQYGAYDGQAEWMGAPVHVTVAGEGSGDTSTTEFRTAHSFWANQKEWTDRLIAHACAEKLELANDSWLDEPITPEAFRARLFVKGFAFEEGDSFLVILGCDDIFSDHGLMVTGTLAKGFDEVTLC